MATAKKGASGRGRAARQSMGVAQLRALSHPLRMRLLELFSARPRTTMQAAEALGEAPTRLYHHVAALERAGLIALKETRQNRGTTEKYYQATAQRYEVAAEAAGLGRKSAARDHAAMGVVLFEQARQEFLRALATEPPAGKTALIAVRGVFRLSPEKAVAVAKRLQALLESLRAELGGADGAAGAAGKPGGKPTVGGARRAAAKDRSTDRGAPPGTDRRRYALTLAFVPADEAGGQEKPGT